MKYTHNNLYLWMCIAINIPSVICVFKLTNAVCESYNESWVVINTCRLKALRRDTTALYLNVTLVEPVENVVLNVALLKRANGYKPFLYNFTADVCQYLAKRNNPVFNLVFKFIKPYLIIDHWCPFEGFLIMSGMYLKLEYLQNLPVPDGDFVLAMKWIVNNFHLVTSNFFFTLKS